VASRIDWAALLKVDPDLPAKLNRAFFSVDAESRALRALIADLQTQVDGIDVELPDVGTPGTYGGAPLFIESVTTDAKGRVTAVVEGTPNGATAEGSIFSMVGPGGASDPVVAYDFTKYDPSLSDAQNLLNANLSGDSTLDLTAVGAAKIIYLANSNNTGQSPYALTPFGGRSDGGALQAGGQANYVVTSGAPSAIRFTGAMTAEILLYFTEQASGVDDLYLYNFAAAGETEAANNLYELAWFTGTQIWHYLSEHGAGVDDTAGFFTSPLAQQTDMLFVPALFTLTRSASRKVNLYVNGRATFGEQTIASMPTGGTTSNLSIGFGATANKFAILGFRLFGADLTPAQARESYLRSMFGVAA
jgi:hypothetical protein